MLRSMGVTKLDTTEQLNKNNKWLYVHIYPPLQPLEESEIPVFPGGIWMPCFREYCHTFTQLSQNLMQNVLGDTRGLGRAFLSPGEGVEGPTDRWGILGPVQC